jgi:hypothetical protein
LSALISQVSNRQAPANLQNACAQMLSDLQGANSSTSSDSIGNASTGATNPQATLPDVCWSLDRQFPKVGFFLQKSKFEYIWLDCLQCWILWRLTPSSPLLSLPSAVVPVVCFGVMSSMRLKWISTRYQWHRQFYFSPFNDFDSCNPLESSQRENPPCSNPPVHPLTLTSVNLA